MNEHVPPLSALLSRVIAAITATYRRAGADTAPNPSLPMWAALLRVVTTTPTAEADIVRASRLSKRATRAALTGARRHGWITLEPSGVRGAGSVVALSDEGCAVHDEWPTTIAAAADQRWHATVAEATSERARKAAAALVERLDLEWPHYPVSYGTADPSVTGGFHTAADDGPPRIPPHGQDWRPVLRTSTPDDLPLYAVLAQALLQFASEYEAHGAGSLRTAYVLQDVDDDWVPLADFPPAAQVTGAGRSGLERHGVVDVKTDPTQAKAKLVRPSAIGRGIRDAYDPLTTRIEERWRDAYDDEVVSELRATLDDIADHDAPDYLIVNHLVR